MQTHMENNEPWDSFGWSKAQYFNFLRSNMRRAFIKYPAGYACLEPYTTFEYTTYKNGKPKKQKWIRCARCGKLNIPSHIQVDHEVPCGSLKGFDDLERFISTLFCGTDNLVPLCKDTCHATKTLAEKQAVSFEQAKLIKEAITFSKLPVATQLSKLKELGIWDKGITNADKRRQCYQQWLERSNENVA